MVAGRRGEEGRTKSITIEEFQLGREVEPLGRAWNIGDMVCATGDTGRILLVIDRLPALFSCRFLLIQVA
jgi:hypothetical protein